MTPASILEQLRAETAGEDLDLSWLDQPAAERGLRIAGGNQLHMHSQWVHIGQVFSIGRNGTAGDCVPNGTAGELSVLQVGKQYRATTPQDPGKHTRKGHHTYDRYG